MVLSIRKGVEFFNSKIHSLITFFFYLILIGVSIQSWSNLMEESTTFDERFVENKERFPSFTLCPNDNDDNKKSIESFEDVAEQIENVKSNFVRKYYEYLPYEEAKIVDETQNQTLNNGWYFVPKTGDFSPYKTVICLIMSLSNKHNPDKINTYMIEMQSFVSKLYYLQIHQEGQSPYAYKSAEEETNWIGNDSYVSFTFTKQTITLYMNKHRYSCKEDNQNYFMQCLEKYYSKRLGCLLPWSIENGKNNHTANVCLGKDKFQEYKNISMNILKPEEQIYLIKDGCFIPNCQQRSWETKKEILTGYEASGFEFIMPKQPKVLVRREMKLYTPINFFADVGGYLGLLLGESLISYIIIITKLIHLIGKKLRDKCRKKPKKSHKQILFK